MANTYVLYDLKKEYICDVNIENPDANIFDLYNTVLQNLSDRGQMLTDLGYELNDTVHYFSAITSMNEEEIQKLPKLEELGKILMAAYDPKEKVLPKIKKKLPADIDLFIKRVEEFIIEVEANGLTPENCGFVNEVNDFFIGIVGYIMMIADADQKQILSKLIQEQSIEALSKLKDQMEIPLFVDALENEIIPIFEKVKEFIEDTL